MKEEIYTGIKKYVKSKPSVWHTPGHKGLLSRYDITEIDKTFPGESIAKAEACAAEIFGAKTVRFLTGGSSIGIKAGLMSLSGDVLIESNCHCAINQGLKLAGKKAIVIQNQIKNGLPQPLSQEQIEAALDSNKNIKTVVVTSPDYYGQIANIAEIANITNKNGVYLYVDAAHGAHFSFRTDLFPTSSTSLADICNISAHKTLPAFTQSAYLCINDESLLPAIDENLALLGTTSPSYLLCSGLEFAACYCKNNSKYYNAILAACDEFKKAVKCLNNDDFTRLVVDASHYAISGDELYFRLKKLGVTAEKYDRRYVVFIVSIVDTIKKINALKNTVIKALQKQ